MKRNDGFTMVELLITIVAAAVVTVAAASLILLGTRIQHASTADASEQQTVRIVMTMLEKMAGSGKIKKVENSYTGWTLTGEADDVLFEYVAEEQILYGGAKKAGGTVLLDGLNGAGVRMEDSLLHFTFDTVRGGSYETAVYCRALNITETAADITDVVKYTTAGKRLDFLNALVGEYQNGQNAGQIAGTEQYYSEWYIGGYADNPGWNKDTPWCACFLSWAAVKSGIVERKDSYCFANVDTGISAFRDASGNLKSAPEPGDYVFFDWSGKKSDPAHVGAVLNVEGNTIYTIEGNSGGVIAVRQYNKDSSVIMGYGALPFGG